MEILEYGVKNAAVVLIQPIGGHDLSGLGSEVQAIQEMTGKDILLLAVKVHDWNRDLSPWEAPAVFGNEDFGNGAAGTLEEILQLCTDKSKTYCIGGYSLAALFALWAACQTDVFAGAAAASPSIWFPGFLDYMREQGIKAEAVYLSLGDREEKTRNPVMARVGDCIREGYRILQEQNKNCVLEWNPGNHFRDADLRTAKAFAWLISSL